MSVFDVPGVNELYQLDPAEFTDARNAIAKDLQKQGEKALAAEVKALRKPVRLAWAINRVARDNPQAVEELLEAGQAVRAAQEAAMTGGGGAALRDATKARRDVIAKLAREAAKIAGSQYKDDAAITLEAASVSAEAGELLRHGRLTTEIEPPSAFDVFDMPEPKAEVQREDLHHEHELKRLQKAVEDADSRLGAAEARLQRAKVTLSEAQRAATEAENALEEAQTQRDAAASDLNRLRN